MKGSETLDLRTGDRVEWSAGKFNMDKMTGVVLEDLGDGSVDLVSHTLNRKPWVLGMNVEKRKLTLIY
jgi:hypothetical protein